MLTQQMAEQEALVGGDPIDNKLAHRRPSPRPSLLIPRACAAARSHRRRAQLLRVAAAAAPPSLLIPRACTAVVVVPSAWRWHSSVRSCRSRRHRPEHGSTPLSPAFPPPLPLLTMHAANRPWGADPVLVCRRSVDPLPPFSEARIH